MSGSLDFGLFFSGFRQRRSWIDGILAVVRMLLFECVFRFRWEVLTVFQNIRKFFDDFFDLFPVESRTDPDNKTRDLIHRFALRNDYDKAIVGGRQAKKSKLSEKTEDKKIKS